MSPLLWVAMAFAGDPDEDALFGGSPAPPPPAPEAPSPETPAAETPAAPVEAPVAPVVPPPPVALDPYASPDAGEMLDGGSSMPTDLDIQRALAAVDQRFAIGGRLYLRLDSTVDEDDSASEVGLRSPNLLDVYLDARPNDRLRAYGAARLSHDFTVQSGDTDFLGGEVVLSKVILDQLWMKGDIDHRVYWTVGRQRIKWGAGRFWNPTDFMNQQVLDPLAAFDERTGVALVKVHVPIEAIGANLYVLGNVEGADTLGQVGGAARMEWLVGNTEISASAAARRDQPIRLGADLSTGVWVFDLHAEAAVQHGAGTTYYAGTLAMDTLFAPETVDRSEEWIPQMVGGIELPIRYNDEDAVSIGVEGFYNDAGYTDADIYSLLIPNGAFQPFYLGRAYAGAYVYLPSPGNWDEQSYTASALSNLTDRSMVARLDWRATVHTRLAVNAYVSGHFGEKGGEFRFAFDLPDDIATALGEADGIHVPAPIVDAGVGLSLSF